MKDEMRRIAEARALVEELLSINEFACERPDWLLVHCGMTPLDIEVVRERAAKARKWLEETR